MKIGIALGSGAARGWAHIGIIQALEEMGIPIDVVAGCSIGAYVGSAYASGNLDSLGEWASSLTEWQVLRLMGVGFMKGGLASGQKVFQALEDNFCKETFEELHKPLAVVATDLYTGKEVSFLQGPIGTAVRASCAIPALFPPVSYQGRWLVDGAVVNPVPVNLCRQLGADFVFAVNLSADFRPQIQHTFEQEHEHNQQKTNDFFSKSQAFMQWLKRDKTEPTDEQLEQMTQQQEQAQEGEVHQSESVVAETVANLGEASQDLPTSDMSDAVSTTPSVAKLKPVSKAPPSMLGVMSSSLDILQARVTRSRLAGDPPDILIEPQLRDFGIMEFHRAAELIQEGRQCVERVAEQIKYQLRIS